MRLDRARPSCFRSGSGGTRAGRRRRPRHNRGSRAPANGVNSAPAAMSGVARSRLTASIRPRPKFRAIEAQRAHHNEAVPHACARLALLILGWRSTTKVSPVRQRPELAHAEGSVAGNPLSALNVRYGRLHRESRQSAYGHFRPLSWPTAMCESGYTLRATCHITVLTAGARCHIDRGLRQKLQRTLLVE